jgi:hypothetical protein
MVAKKPKNHRKPWAANDIKKLEEEKKHNTPTPLIALHLERTESSIRSKAAEIGLSLKPTNKPPYGTGGKRRSSKG